VSDANQLSMVMLLLKATGTIVVPRFQRAVVAGAAHGVPFHERAACTANDAATKLSGANGTPKLGRYSFAG